VAVLLGYFDAGYVAAAGKHDKLGSRDGGGDRLSLRGAADEVEFAGHDECGARDAAQQWAQVNGLEQAGFPGLARRQVRFQAALMLASLAATSGLSGSAT
jgi:hypothetical protein